MYFNRQSIDIYSSVQSPNLSFLGTPTLSRLSNSFLTNSFRGKTPEIISNLVKPLLRPTTSDEQQQPQQQQQQHEDIRKSSQYLLPSRKPSLQQIPEDQKPLVVGHEVSPYQQCSYTQGAMNGKHLEQIYGFQGFFFLILKVIFFFTTEMLCTCQLLILASHWINPTTNYMCAGLSWSHCSMRNWGPQLLAFQNILAMYHCWISAYELRHVPNTPVSKFIVLTLQLDIFTRCSIMLTATNT